MDRIEWVESRTIEVGHDMVLINHNVLKLCRNCACEDSDCGRSLLAR